MSSSPVSSLLPTDLSSFIATPPSTYEYNSGFSQQSFLTTGFNVTLFINKCATKISQVMNDDFKQTLNLIDEDMKGDEEIKTEIEIETNDDVFACQHLTASNLKQLHLDLHECHENIKQELINLFETNYPQFLELNESLRSGTQTNIKKCVDSLNNMHKKYNNMYQQILRLLQGIYSKSKLKSDFQSKINKLKQIQFVVNIIQNIRQSLKQINNDFDPFKNMNMNGRHLKINNNFKQLFCDEISESIERKQYRLLHKSSRLECIAILLCKLSAIFADNQLNQHLLIVNQKTEFLSLRNRFYVQLKDVFLSSIENGSLLSLRSNLRCYNYLSIVKPEEIVRETYIKPAIFKCLPITIFMNNKNNIEKRREIIYLHFNKLYDLLCDKLSILFCVEIMEYNNDFIANSIWYSLVDILLNEDYNELFISRGLPDLFHINYSAIMIFFRKIQKLYYLNEKMKVNKKNIEADRYLYFDESSVKLRKKCNLSQYYLFRMPFITSSVMDMATHKYSNINYHFKIYLNYYHKMRNDNDNKPENVNENEMDGYISRLKSAKQALNNNKTNKINNKVLDYKHFEYNYNLPIFQVSIINCLKCWDSSNIFICDLSASFLTLTTQILSFLYNFLHKQIENESIVLHSTLLILLHSDLFHFCNWIKYELLPLIKYQFTYFIPCTNIKIKNDIKLLINKAINPLSAKLEELRDNLLNKIIINTILNECKLVLYQVDELADSWQANISFQTDANEDENENIFNKKISKYVSKLFKPLKDFLIFVNEHSLEHIDTKQKNNLIWDILNGICEQYWNKIKNVQQRLAEIRKVMEQRRKRRFKKNKSDSDLKGKNNKSGAEKTGFQLFLDVRQFMQQIQGFINGIQIDEKKLRLKEMEKEKKEQEEENEKNKSSIIVIKKKKKRIIQRIPLYAIEKLKCWSDFNTFVDQFQ